MKQYISKDTLRQVLQNRIFAGIVIALLNFFLFQWVVGSGFLYSWNFRLTDNLYETGNRTSSDIVIVKIDDSSLRPLPEGGLGRWQDWSRDYYATVLQNLSQAGARSIGMDVLFLDASANKEADAKLAEVVQKSEQVILASKFDFERNEFLKPLSSFYGGDENKVAMINIPIDSDNIARKTFLYLPYDHTYYESFDVKVLKKYLNEPTNNLSTLPLEGENYVITAKKSKLSFDLSKVIPPIKVPVTDENLMYINFFGSPFSFQTISFVDAYTNKFDPNLVKDKIILIGEMGATGLHDVQYTPVSKGQEMPGVEIHANSIQTLLTQKFLRTQDLKKQIWSIGLVNVFTTFLFLFLPVLLSTVVLVVGIFLFIVASILAFNSGLLLNMFYIPVSYILVYIFCVIYKYTIESSGRRYLKQAFAHYVSPQLVEKIIQNPKLLKLGGAKKQLTIMFSDLQGFTSLSEKLSPEELVSMLNSYLTDMTNIVFEHQGTLDKYIGDAVMAFWGAPLDDPEHAYHACLTALAMQKKMKEIHEYFKREKDLELYVRIGFNTGEVIVGNVGSEGRFDYTVIGDHVNLASRLEGANKQYGTFMMLSESTYTLVKDRFEFRELDLIKVKGKTRPVRIFELLDMKGKLDVEKQTLMHIFQQGLLAYRNQEWDKALKFFQDVQSMDPQDGPSQTYIERCKYLKENPPETGWDGSFQMKTK